MNKYNVISLLLFVFAFLTLSTYAQENQDNSMPPKEKWSLITMEGRVTALEKDTREVTLMGPKGDLVTITAGDAVERFDEIMVDDVISFEYWTYMMAEFRQPTPEEQADPLVVLAEAGKVPDGMDPAAAIGAIVKAVVVIEVLNRPYMLATIRGPRGNFMTIEMEDKALIEKLHVGQVVILTYAEAIAVSLNKVKSDL